MHSHTRYWDVNSKRGSSESKTPASFHAPSPEKAYSPICLFMPITKESQELLMLAVLQLLAISLPQLYTPYLPPLSIEIMILRPAA
jgi:hypothetical protein